MGESIVDSSNFEDKIAGTASSNAALEVSVSFGRFENDSLSWERFSTFSPNKYLEEVEKCATPGSVAEKRAYFEAHYKKIAAGKAELMDQEKQMGNENSRFPHDHNFSGDLAENSFETNFAYDSASNSQDSEAVEQETNSVSEVSSSHVGEANGGASLTSECQSSAVKRVKEELYCGLGSPDIDRSEEGGTVREEEIEEAPEIELKDIKEVPQNLDNETVNAKKTKDENVKSDRPKASRKIITEKKEKSTPGVKKKLAPPITKTQQFSTPRASKQAPTKAQQFSTPRVSKSAPTKGPQFSSLRVSKPVPTEPPQFSTPRVSKPAPATPTVMTSSKSSKKENGSSIPWKNNPSAGESKRAQPKSLHMSLSTDTAPPAHSDPASLTKTRKSLIMESMGDKDIVKRAFKTFQNNFSQLKSCSEERSSIPDQASARGTELKVSGTITVHIENGGSIKVGGTEKRNAKAAPSSFGLKSNEKTQKHKEFSKKLEEKSNTGQGERTQVQPKFKEQKEAEVKKLTPDFNLKASPMPGLYHGRKISTNPSH